MKIKKIFDRLAENWLAKVISFALAIVLVQLYKGSLLEKKIFLRSSCYRKFGRSGSGCEYSEAG